MSKPPSSIIERLEAKTDKSSGCWLWTGATNGQGYGRMSMPPKRYVYAHRTWFEQVRGPIPDGMQLDHLCRNPRCVNPAHLEPVTNAENTRRGKISALRPSRSHCHRGHDLAVSGYIDSQGRNQCRACLSIRQKAYHERKRDAQS